VSKNKYIFLFSEQEYVGYWSQACNGIYSRYGTNIKVKAVLVVRQQYIAFQQGVNTACFILVTAVLGTVSAVRVCLIYTCRPRERPRSRWEDNIKMDLQEVGCEVVDWIELSQDRDRWRALVIAVLNLRGYIKCGILLY